MPNVAPPDPTGLEFDGDDGEAAPLLDLNEYGATGLKRFSGYILEEDHPRLTGRRLMRILREMGENDATVGACQYIIRALLLGTDFRLDPADESPEAREVQAFVESVFADMAHTWDEFLSEVVSCLLYGWAAFEKVYKVRRGPAEPDPRYRSRYADGRIGLRKLAIRAQTSLLRWEFSHDGALMGLWQNAPPDYQMVFVPIEKLVLFRPSAPLDNPEGRSLYRNAYRPWFLLKRLQEIEATGIERDLSGLPVMQLPLALMMTTASASQKALRAQFETMVQKVRRDEREGVVVPAEEETDAEGVTRKTGYKFELLSTGGRRAVDVRPAIDSYARDIARVVCAELIFLGTDPNGSRSLADSKTSTFAQALGAFLDIFTSTVQRYVIEPLVEVNGWALDLAPKLEHGDIETPDLAAAADYVTKLVTAGLITPDTDLERFLRAQAKLPQLDTTGTTGDNGATVGGPKLVVTPPAAPGAVPEGERAPNVRTERQLALDAPVGTPVEAPPAAQVTPPAAQAPAAPSAAPSAPAPAPVPSDTAMAGGQVTSLLAVVASVQAGSVPPETAIAILVHAFTLTDAAARAIIGPLVPGSTRPVAPVPPAAG